MEIVIDTTRLVEFSQLPIDQMLWVFFINVGWIFLASGFLYGTLLIYKMRISSQWAAKNLKYIILAVDVPKGNEQSPKAVENMFTYLGGAHGSINFFEKWFEGKFQPSFSYEIVSLEGYTQFLIRTPVEYRNLIETSIYSQYPDAEISEVDDYVDTVPHTFPDEEYDIWGSEFIQSKDWSYPIKMYREFEHTMGPSETQFKDPMASLMDLCGSLREGEQFWFQLIVIPTGFDWIAQTDKAVEKILGKKKSSTGFFSKALEWLGVLSEMIFSIWGDIEDKKSDDKGMSMVELSPKQHKQVEAIQAKSSKLAFEAKIRVIYVARREVMNRSKVTSGFVGYIKQFASLDLNNLKPDTTSTMTKTAYFNKDKRLIRKKNAIMTNYINRDDYSGRAPGIYDIEELATLWHFPLEANVKSPLVQKAPGRKADAPSSLPMVDDFIGGTSPELFNLEVLRRERQQPEKNDEAEQRNSHNDSKASAPENLPFA
ncbi:hypothetical protein CVU83_02835 [Candidatus Falkowbacteria bacterium HGW-Falkowbacteria-2]|uniref:DUF8128 domain-containing protein n=1 Tax=Candidatus Falkowbacteria bacterium HGW-Falkowbacteria-2 TaxID=2013769 RepID=A0A2N2DYQ3_9BACT|nr:MAG: hypothetical protein CVU83_02835 [Candidatus Falkowbacteria bacterium HGW-Falkowbacteria-2]